MATELDDLSLHLDPSLYLPIRGTVYEITAPTITEADRIRELIWAKPLGAEELHDEIVTMLGASHAKMAADGVLSPERDHAGMTALVHFGASAILGRAYWEFEHLASRIDIAALIAGLEKS
ncbi:MULTISPECIES: hypothetical protein [unclassified Rhodococcus (in: high G+C Gram-positive bacteria)]|uniref:DUF7426 family protein n=1 Tax=unclassified Rhodococcus (in: high G+C Gram-positive bacteria) TaxID=192944 RepID=UPI0006F2A22E|nr:MULTISPECIES: hypothetical protein [unclassified Rhodococcus (in: high G+C Gram-positive bacteria)]KQU30345.1 hypothetical protein ASG69_04625 [Rhodococcus sp. Leaf225]KQU44750.1 hypothetical protein ASH03_12515 [Rhodococcus sp. Leaf258]